MTEETTPTTEELGVAIGVLDRRSLDYAAGDQLAKAEACNAVIRFLGSIGGRLGQIADVSGLKPSAIGHNLLVLAGEMDLEVRGVARGPFKFTSQMAREVKAAGEHMLKVPESASAEPAPKRRELVARTIPEFCEHLRSVANRARAYEQPAVYGMALDDAAKVIEDISGRTDLSWLDDTQPLPDQLRDYGEEVGPQAQGLVRQASNRIEWLEDALVEARKPPGDWTPVHTDPALSLTDTIRALVASAIEQGKPDLGVVRSSHDWSRLLLRLDALEEAQASPAWQSFKAGWVGQTTLDAASTPREDFAEVPPAMTETERALREGLARFDRNHPDMNERMALSTNQDPLRNFLEHIDRDREELRVLRAEAKALDPDHDEMFKPCAANGEAAIRARVSWAYHSLHQPDARVSVTAYLADWDAFLAEMDTLRMPKMTDHTSTGATQVPEIETGSPFEVTEGDLRAVYLFLREHMIGSSDIHEVVRIILSRAFERHQAQETDVSGTPSLAAISCLRKWGGVSGSKAVNVASQDHRTIFLTAADLLERYRNSLLDGIADQETEKLRPGIYVHSFNVKDVKVTTDGVPEGFERVGNGSLLRVITNGVGEWRITEKPGAVPNLADIPAWLDEHADLISCPITAWVSRNAALEIRRLRTAQAPGPAVGPNPGTQARTGHYAADAKPLEPAHISDGDAHADRLRFEQGQSRSTRCPRNTCRISGQCIGGVARCLARRFEGDGRL